MAIKVYLNSDGTGEVTSTNPDSVRQAVDEGNTSEEISPIYLQSDDTTLTYENVFIRKNGSATDNTVYVDYALNQADFDTISAGSQEELSLSNGDYSTVTTVYRRITAPNVTDAFISENEVYHQVQRDDYIK